MIWQIDENKQIHPQLVDEITKRIIQGAYSPGEKIPSVRELALEAKVNPNTMQKALLELEEKKIIETRRTTGKFVTANEADIDELKKTISTQIARKFAGEVKSLGLNSETVLEMIRSEFDD